MNYDQNNCQQFSFITPIFSDTCQPTQVGDVVGCIFDVKCSVGGFLILKQIIWQPCKKMYMATLWVGES
jgi:hypothetical protein